MTEGPGILKVLDFLDLFCHVMAYVLSSVMGKEIFNNPNKVPFSKLLALYRTYFDEPRISGSHHMFKKLPGRGTFE